MGKSAKQTWEEGYRDFANTAKKCAAAKEVIPKPVLVLLKEGLGITKVVQIFGQALAKRDPQLVQKAFLALQKAIHAMAHPIDVAMNCDASETLHEAVMMFNAYPSRTQTAADEERTKLLEDLGKETKEEDVQLRLQIRKIMSSSSFAADWEQQKKAFSRETGESKPAEKKWGIRKGTGIEAALKDLDATCVKADPKAYGKAWGKFDQARQKYSKLLDDVIGKEKEDKDYVRACQQLKDLLKQINVRAEGLLTNLKNLEKQYPKQVFC
ncbi:MAG: hypothetical protein NTY19_50870 [Planctomycetota bacterium]|nr:hypothetical protein [Planctomycetota bacterium]